MKIFAFMTGQRARAALWRAAFATVLLFSASAAHAQNDACPFTALKPGERLLAVISDLHFGLGHQSDGSWNPMEDFRWSGALQGFLDRVSACGNDAVDLVIAGDMLELWQLPPGIACADRAPDLGCTPSEAAAATRALIANHGTDLLALGGFAKRGDNRLVILPGNHDAALLLDEPWRLVQSAIGAPAGRVSRPVNGLFTWANARVLVEHGQQIGKDVNRYDAWPQITRASNGKTYLIRPWGENFVQALFNQQESNYPVIDNLSPESAGARFRMADRGLWGSVADVARLVAFNLFETSWGQKDAVLGSPDAKGTAWDYTLARAHGHKLIVATLPTDDPFRASMTSASPEAAALRGELDQLMADPARMPDAEVSALCERVEALAAEPGAALAGEAVRCKRPALGAIAQKLRPKHAIMAEHLRARLGEPGLSNTAVFVYGHTHELELPWTVNVADGRNVTVLNTGAFQRVVDEPGFLARAKARGWAPAEALRQLRVEDLAACYTAVLVTAPSGRPQADTLRWHQAEGGEKGQFVKADDAACR